MEKGDVVVLTQDYPYYYRYTVVYYDDLSHRVWITDGFEHQIQYDHDVALVMEDPSDG